MKKTSLIALTSLAALTVQAQTTTLDQWTFTSGTPQVSDTQSKTMGNWDPALAGTSVPSAGLLRDATGGNSSGAFYGANLGLAGSFDTLSITLEIADINHSQRDYWFEWLGPEVGAGNFRGEINAFNDGISFDVEGNGTVLSPSGSIFSTADYTGAISMDVTFTWDFLNNTMSYTVAGDGVGYTGSGSSAFSDTQTIAADLSAITDIRSMRVRGGTVGVGEFIDLDTVTIQTTVVPEPSTAGLMAGLLAFGSMALRRRRA